MSKPIMISDENYAVMDSLREQVPDKKEYESFNTVLDRLLVPYKSKPSGE